MRSKVNLLRHGYEAVADRIKRTLLERGGTRTLVVRADGTVNLYPSDEYIAADPSLIVGTYTRQARTEEIEDDLIFHLRLTQA